MKIVKITNLLTGEFYYDRVDDSESKRDPANFFVNKLRDNGNSNITGLDVEIVKRNLSPELATSELIRIRIKESGNEKHRTPFKRVADVNVSKQILDTLFEKETNIEATQPIENIELTNNTNKKGKNASTKDN